MFWAIYKRWQALNFINTKERFGPIISWVLFMLLLMLLQIFSTVNQILKPTFIIFVNRFESVRFKTFIFISKNVELDLAEKSPYFIDAHNNHCKVVNLPGHQLFASPSFQTSSEIYVCKSNYFLILTSSCLNRILQ